MKVTAFDDDGGKDDLLGFAFVDLDPYANQPYKQHHTDVFLLYDDKQVGKVSLII